ncbi:MAG: hypothetical protein MK486_06220 [Gemmatimonadetes bacterium]|nr:hypothetical protein [Gemmatimonadota bacterium]
MTKLPYRTTPILTPVSPLSSMPSDWSMVSRKLRAAATTSSFSTASTLPDSSITKITSSRADAAAGVTPSMLTVTSPVSVH